MQQRKQGLLLILTVFSLLGGGVAIASTGGAVAQATGQTQVAQETIEVWSQSGQVQQIHVGVSGHVEWEGLPADAERVEVAMRLPPEETADDREHMERNRDTFPVERNQTFQIDGGTSGEYEFDNVSLQLAPGLYSSHAGFSAFKDNTTARNQVEVDIVQTVTDAEGNTVNHTERHRIRVIVHNEPPPEYDATASGSASLSVSTQMCSVEGCGEEGQPGNGDIGRQPESFDE